MGTIRVVPIGTIRVVPIGRDALASHAVSVYTRFSQAPSVSILAVGAEALSMTPSGDALKKDLEERKQYQRHVHKQVLSFVCSFVRPLSLRSEKYDENLKDKLPQKPNWRINFDLRD